MQHQGPTPPPPTVQPSPPPQPPPPSPQMEEKMEVANSQPGPCACEASITDIKTKLQSVDVQHRALKLRADQTESRFTDLLAPFAKLLADERNAALFEEAIEG